VVLLVAVMGAVAFIVPLSATDLGASPGLLGLVMSISAIGSLVAAVPAGLLVERAGTRRPLVAACLLAGASVAGVALSYSMAAVLLCFSVFRVAEIVIFVAFQAHVAGMSPPGADTTRYFGWYGFAASLGQLVGPTAAGVLLEAAGHRWSWALTAAAFAAVAALTLLLVSRRPGARPKASPPAREGLWRVFRGGRWKAMLGSAGIVAIIASFVVIFASGSRGTYFPVYLTSLGFTPSIAGTLVAVGALAGLLSRILLSALVGLCRGAFGAMLASFFVMTVGMGMTPLCHSPVALALNSFLVGIGGGVALPLSMATVAQSAPEGLRAVAMGVRLTGNRLAMLANPLLFGLVSSLWGVPSAFVAAAAVLLIATVGLGGWWRARGRAAG
jgi:MFS family permease